MKNINLIAFSSLPKMLVHPVKLNPNWNLQLIVNTRVRKTIRCILLFWLRSYCEDKRQKVYISYGCSIGCGMFPISKLGWGKLLLKKPFCYDCSRAFRNQQHRDLTWRRLCFCFVSLPPLWLGSKSCQYCILRLINHKKDSWAVGQPIHNKNSLTYIYCIFINLSISCTFYFLF